MLAINTAVEWVLVETITTAHAGYVSVAEDDIFQKLTMIGLTLSMEYVALEDVVHIMALDLE